MSGINQDVEPIRQPKGKYRFALNMVMDEEYSLSTEPSALPCLSLKDGYKVIGQVYVGDGEIVLFLSNTTNSAIAVVKDCQITYEVEFPGLRFFPNYKIQAIYRVRNGCDKYIYWTDGYNKPRYYVLGKQYLFQDVNGNWDVEKFNLLTTYNTIANLDVEVVDGGGNLKPGSYNVAIQYVDSNLNPTTIVNVTDTYIIYNDGLSQSVKLIRGSNTFDQLGNAYPNTSKALNVKISNLDQSYEYYRLIFIEATDGSGFVSEVKYSQLIPTSSKVYLYTGDNYEYKGSYNELLAQRLEVMTAKTIEQIENRIVLGNIKTTTTKYCELQRYASKINADCIVYKVPINRSRDKENYINPHLNNTMLGYQPGEIYSFGIVYIFEDGTTSPVYHIPGKNHNYSPSHIFDNTIPSDPLFVGVYGMSLDNELENIYYQEEGNCSYKWYEDSYGEELQTKKIRHHRFPRRKDIGVNLIEKVTIDNIPVERFCFTRNSPFDPLAIHPTGIPIKVEVIVKYEANGIVKTQTYDFYPPLTIPFTFCTDWFQADNSANVINITEVYHYIDGLSYDTNVNDNALSEYSFLKENDINSINDEFINVFGIRFSNIEIPSFGITGKEVIGYYIVRNERTDGNMTIIDSGIVSRAIDYKRVIGLGHLAPEFRNGTCQTYYNRSCFQLITPRILNRDISLGGNYGISHELSINKDNVFRSLLKKQDVLSGTSYNPEEDKNKYEDKDGWTLKIISRDTEVSYGLNDVCSPANSFDIPADKVRRIGALAPFEEAVGMIWHTGSNQEKQYIIRNFSFDNDVGYIILDEPLGVPGGLQGSYGCDNSLPYVYITRELKDPYGNFVNEPFYKTHTNINYFNSTSPVSIDVFGGDCYIFPIRLTSMMQYGNRVAKRCKKSGIGQILSGVGLTLLGVLNLVFPVAGGPETSFQLISKGGQLIVSGIKIEKIKNRYYKDFDPEEAKELTDCWVRDEYEYKKYPGTEIPETGCDDELQWISDHITNAWFESKIPMQWRYGKIGDKTGFLDTPDTAEYMAQSEPKEHRCNNNVICTKDEAVDPKTIVQRYALDKLLTYDDNNELTYTGVAHKELYDIDKDYLRRNKEQVFFAIDFSYDCCSDCGESFPNRIYYSQQSFQEERNDNYRVFLPNNYRDIESYTGEITNVVRWFNRLLIHTKYALWILLPSIQERVNRDIITYIGTGEFFGIPPRKVGEGEFMGGGLEHFSHSIKTKTGYYFVSLEDKKIYLYRGEGLIPISDTGIRTLLEDFIDDKEKGRVSYIACGEDLYFNRVMFTIRVLIQGEEVPDKNKYITLSYYPNYKSFISLHSYHPYIYINDNEYMYSFDFYDSNLYKHLRHGHYRTFYRGIIHPSIIEEVYQTYPLPKVLNDILFDTISFIYSDQNNLTQRVLSDDITFNKAIIYNSKQNTGLLEFMQRREGDTNYMDVRVRRYNQVLIEKRERFWSINTIRNQRNDFTQEMWIKRYDYNGANIWEDKILNPTQFSLSPNWNDEALFIDKYVITRFIFDINEPYIKLMYRLHFVEDTYSLR